MVKSPDNASKPEYKSANVDALAVSKKLPELWEHIKAFVLWWGIHSGYKRALDLEDDELFSIGYLAMARAAESYDASKGTFLTHLVFYLKSEIQCLTGRSERQKRDPIYNAVSLDKPISEGGDDLLSDVIADPHDAYEAADDKIWHEQLHKCLERVLNGLPPECSQVIRHKFYDDMTLSAIGRDMGISPEEARKCESRGLHQLRYWKNRKELEQFVETHTPYYCKVGVREFNTTNTSAVEKIVLRREKLTEQYSMC